MGVSPILIATAPPLLLPLRGPGAAPAARAHALLAARPRRPKPRQLAQGPKASCRPRRSRA
eukprot:9669651-Lingulodinium_polyedra.AAC.1